MEVSISVFWLVGIILLAVIIGYLIGQNERKLLKEDEAENVGEGKERGSEETQRGKRRIFLGKSIVSPVDGRVHFFCEGGRKGAMIEPQQGKVYAPASGKIIKLYPMGNAFLLRTDDGNEILIRVGRQHPDELCSMYFRARVVQNEIVNKGKLLLEFDKEGLLASGEDVTVTVCAQSLMDGEEIVVTEEETVKVGELLIQFS